MRNRAVKVGVLNFKRKTRHNKIKFSFHLIDSCEDVRKKPPYIYKLEVPFKVCLSAVINKL